MNKIFADMFSAQPDEIIGGDYYYHSPWHEEMQDTVFSVHKGITVKELKERNKQRWLGSESSKGSFGHSWDTKTFQSDYCENLTAPDTAEEWIIEFQSEIESGFSKANEILGKIAADNKPFLDISSGESWGLIPFITKMNPKIPCMATDVYAHLIKCLRLFADSTLPQYNISLTCFDNNNMPIKNDSLDYVTGTFAISSSASENSQKSIDSSGADKVKSASEVYRILKPGGRFVIIENINDWVFDLTKARKSFGKHGKLFGIYTCDEIESAYNALNQYSLQNVFNRAGFITETAERYPITGSFGYKNDIEKAVIRLRNALGMTANEEPLSCNNPMNLYEEAKNYGIEFMRENVFYVLRKPD